MTKNKNLLIWIAVLAVVSTVAAVADEEGMFGNTRSRNMVSDETGLPGEWDVDSGKNVKWVQDLGSQSYGGPVVVGERIYVGTNNQSPRDPEITGDKGVVMAFDRESGDFLWQRVHDKLPDGRVHDWPLQGVCSGPAVEGDDLWYVSNRAELVKASTDGKDGWSLDMIGELDVFPHNLAAGNPLVAGDLVFTVTGNGVDEGHINIPTPMAPSFIAVDKNSGELVWESADPGDGILHGSWSNPAYGTMGGKEQVVFPGGDGWLYSYEPETGELIWKFDCNPKDSVWELGGIGTRNNLISTPVIYGDLVYIAVGQDPEHGEGVGHLWAIDGTGSGDVTESAVVWHRGEEDYHRTISTVAIADDILYAADLTGRLFALDLGTGEELWMYDAFAAIWGSPFVADGRVYLGDEDGDIAVLKHSRKMELLGEYNVGSAVYTTPVAKDGVLYVASRNRLFALEEGAGASGDGSTAGK